MLGRVNKANTMALLLQKSRAGGHAVQNATLSLAAQFILDAAQLRDGFDQTLGFVGIQLVANEHPLALRVGFDGRPDVGHKILLGAGVTHRRANYSARRYPSTGSGHRLKISYQRLGAMPFILELHSLRLARFHRLAWMDALQRLNSSFFIRTDYMHTLFMQFLRLVIQLAYGSDLLPENRFVLHLMIEPISGAMRFEVGLILKNDLRSRSTCCLQSPA